MLLVTIINLPAPMTLPSPMVTPFGICTLEQKKSLANCNMSINDIQMYGAPFLQTAALPLIIRGLNDLYKSVNF